MTSLLPLFLTPSGSGETIIRPVTGLTAQLRQGATTTRVTQTALSVGIKKRVLISEFTGGPVVLFGGQ